MLPHAGIVELQDGAFWQTGSLGLSYLKGGLCLWCVSVARSNVTSALHGDTGHLSMLTHHFTLGTIHISGVGAVLHRREQVPPAVGSSAKALPLLCVSTAVVAKTLPLPCVSTAFVTKTVPFLAVLSSAIRLG